MVGLSVVLEAQKGGSSSNISKKKNIPQVINKTTMMLGTSTTFNTTSPPPQLSFAAASSFLDQCFLCRKRLLPGNDIYMYKGDRAFCSVDCRCKQIFSDEEEAAVQKGDNCSLAAMRPTSSSRPSQTRKGPRNPGGGASGGGGGFAY